MHISEENGIVLQIIAIRTALYLAQELAVFISFSSQKTSLFEKLRAQMSVDGLTIKSLCLTQWTVLTRAVEAIYSNNEVHF